MTTILNLQIMIKRLRLEYLINNYKDLQNKEVINCSKELDKLITEYQRLDLQNMAPPHLLDFINCREGNW